MELTPGWWGVRLHGHLLEYTWGLRSNYMSERRHDFKLNSQEDLKLWEQKLTTVTCGATADSALKSCHPYLTLLSRTLTAHAYSVHLQAPHNVCVLCLHLCQVFCQKSPAPSIFSLLPHVYLIVMLLDICKRFPDIMRCAEHCSGLLSPPVLQFRATSSRELSLACPIHSHSRDHGRWAKLRH